MKSYMATVKFARKGTLRQDGTTSDFGHVWVEVRSNTGKVSSSGWSAGKNKFLGGMENLSTTDNEDYIDTPENPINSISVPITKEQYEKALTFPNRATQGEVEGFGYNYNLF